MDTKQFRSVEASGSLTGTVVQTPPVFAFPTTPCNDSNFLPVMADSPSRTYDAPNPITPTSKVGETASDPDDPTTYNEPFAEETSMYDSDYDNNDSHDGNNDAPEKTAEDTQIGPEAFEEHLFSTRELRPSRNTKRGMPITWIDADDTGDFDPKEEARRLRSRPKRARHAFRNLFDGDSEEHPSEVVNDTGTKTPERPVLCLKFTSSCGKTAFSELCASLPRTLSPARDNFAEGYQLRKRKSAADGNLGNALVQTTGVRTNISDLPDDISNQPIARGCWNCLAMGARCTLLDNEHAWPCEECQANEDDCNLIKEPKFKLACTHCQYLGKRKKWMVCSFEYEDDPSGHRGPCTQCLEDGHTSCIAGPRPGHVHSRIRIGPDGQPYVNRPAVEARASRKNTCRQCLEARRNCSFSSSRRPQTASEICTACDMSGVACERLGVSRALFNRPIPVPTSPPIESAKDHEVTENALSISSDLNLQADEDAKDPQNTQKAISISSSPPRTPEYQPKNRPITLSPDPEDEQPRTAPAKTKTVRTKFCHPIRFDHDKFDPTGSESCHFCSTPGYSLVGLGERRVEVIEWSDGRGWDEIQGGHKGEGTLNTRVCFLCTSARSNIIVCANHELRRIPGLLRPRDVEDAFGDLLDLAPGEKSKDKWCDVCVNLAAWECCAKQEDCPDPGCGLSLCQHCASDVRRHDGNLNDMLHGLVDKPSSERPLGLRADYELLMEGGLLFNLFCKSTSR